MNAAPPRFAAPRMPHAAEMQTAGDRSEETPPSSVSAAPPVPQRVSGIVRPVVRADGALLIHIASGTILYADNKDTIRPLASLTKLMTALVTLDHVTDRDSVMVVTEADDAKSGRLYVRPGDHFRVRDLLSMSLVASANDATLALARASGLDRASFVRAMNEKAGALGLRYTAFSDPTGLDPRNVSTPAEVARLLAAALSQPVLEAELKRKEFRYATADGTRTGVVQSMNRLFEKAAYEIIGGKTGYIEESGYNFATEARSVASGQEFLVVVMGAGSDEGRFAEAAGLLQWEDKAWTFSK